MDRLKPGDAISISHYSGISPFKSIILGLDSETIDLRLTKDFAVMNFLEGDPVVLGFEDEKDVYIFGCNVQTIKSREAVVVLKVDKIDKGAEKREYERYPVSLYADLRLRDNRKKHIATIKDISYYGMLVYSKADLPVNEQLEVDIYMDKKMVFLRANIVRKVQKAHYMEYGLGIMYEDSNSLNFMKDYIKRLMLEQEQAIRKMRHK